MTRAVKFSEAESAAIDAVRGDARWSEWLRSVALAAAGGGMGGPAAPGVAVNLNEPVNLNGAGKPVNRNVAVNRNETPGRTRPAQPPVPAVAGLVPASSLPRRCGHPGKRSVGGWCPDCDHLILTGGAWA